MARYRLCHLSVAQNEMNEFRYSASEHVSVLRLGWFAVNAAVKEGIIELPHEPLNGVHGLHQATAGLHLGGRLVFCGPYKVHLLCRINSKVSCLVTYTNERRINQFVIYRLPFVG